MHAAQRRVDVRYGTASDAATYLGRGRTSFVKAIAPLLHPVAIGSERLYSFDEIDEVMARLAGRPLAEDGDSTASHPPRRGRPRRHAVP